MIEKAVPAPKKSEVSAGTPYFTGGIINFKDVVFPKLDAIKEDAVDATNLLKRSIPEIPDFKNKLQGLLDSLPIQDRGSARDFFVKIYHVTVPEALLSTLPEARKAVEGFLQTYTPHAWEQIDGCTKDLFEAGSELHQLKLDLLNDILSKNGTIPGLSSPEALAAAIDRFNQRGERLGYTTGASRF